MVFQLIVTPKPVSAGAQYGNNRLFLVGKGCHDLEDIGVPASDLVKYGLIAVSPGLGAFDLLTGGKESCGDWEKKLKSELGCSGGMFYQHEFSDGSKKWYTKQGEFKECYNRALAQLNLIEENCKKVKDDTDLWNDKCEDNQNHLHEAVGCDKNFFQDFKEGGKKYWKPKPGAIQDCKNRLAAVSSIKIIKIGPDGKPVEADKPIGDPSVASNTKDPGEDGSSQEPSCDASFDNPLSWILCPVMEMGAKVTDGIFQNLVKPLLQDSPIGIDSNNDFYKVWQSFRNIANIMLIAILLIMVFSQLTEGWGLNIVDAYTAKKMAPRILIGVIAINLSIYLCVAAIDITNIIGNGINYLLTKPFADSGALDARTEGNVESGIVGVLGGGIAAGAITALVVGGSSLLWLGLMALVPILITVSFAALAVLFTLVVRFGLIVFLVVISPIAIACFILPGTEKYFKSWWNLFLKTLMVYPIIAIIFAMANIMSVIFVTNSTEINDSAGVVSLIVGVIAVFVPVFLIPFSFKFAGGAIGTIGKLSSDFANKRAGSLNEKYKKSTHDPNSTLGRFRNKQRGELMERGATGKQVGSGLLAGYRARKRGDSFKDAYKQKSMGIAEEHATSEEGLKKLMSTNAFQAIAGNDVATAGVLAATAPEMEGADFNARRQAAMAAVRQEFKNEDGSVKTDEQMTDTDKLQLRQNTDAAMSLVGAANDKSVANAAILNMAKSKTGFKGGMGDALKHINAINGEDSVATMNMIGRTREAFQAAGRLDGSGASFGSIVETNNAYLEELAGIDKSLANGSITAQEAGERRKDAQGRANIKVARDSGIALSPYQISQAAGDAQKNIAMAMAKDVDTAFTVMSEAELDGSIDFAPKAGSEEAVEWKYKSALGDPISKKEWGMKIVAEADGMYKAIGSMGGKGKDIFGNVLMTTSVKHNGKEMSFNDVLDGTALREDPTFRQFSYEFSSRYQREFAEANAENARQNAAAEGQQ